MVVTLFGIVSLAIFFICMVPYWKDYPDYLSIPISIIGVSFFMLFLNEFAEFSNPAFFMGIHIYLWTFAFAFTFFLYYKKLEPMILYSTMIFFPPGAAVFFGLEFLQTAGAVAYVITAALFYQLITESKRILKYAGAVGMSASIILIFDSLTCIACTNMISPYGLLALAFALWIEGLQPEQFIV